MQFLPAPAEPAHHAIGRGHRQRNEQQEAGEANRDVRPLGNVFDDRREVEGLIKEEVVRKMQGRVSECKESQHAPEAQQRIHTRELTQRRHA